MENFQLRFPDVGEEIFKELDNESLTNSRIINKHWKNLLENEHVKWIGFCQKRRFWIKKKLKNIKISQDNIQDYLLTEIPEELDNYLKELEIPMLKYHKKEEFSSAYLDFYLTEVLS